MRLLLFAMNYANAWLSVVFCIDQTALKDETNV